MSNKMNVVKRGVNGRVLKNGTGLVQPFWIGKGGSRGSGTALRIMWKDEKGQETEILISDDDTLKRLAQEIASVRNMREIWKDSESYAEQAREALAAKSSHKA